MNLGLIDAGARLTACDLTDRKTRVHPHSTISARFVPVSGKGRLSALGRYPRPVTLGYTTYVQAPMWGVRPIPKIVWLHGEGMTMTDRYEWEPRYSVGHPVIDAQHRHLLDLYARAAECLEDDSEEGKAKFFALLNDLAEHSRVNFRTEEEIMAAHGCPQVLLHGEEHLDFIERLADFLLEAAQGTLDKSGLYAFLDSWWQHHVLEGDMQYRPFLSAHRPERVESK